MAALELRLNSLATDLCNRRACSNTPGFNHAAMFFSHSCPFRAYNVWRESA